MGTSEIRWGARDTIATAISTGLDALANGNHAISSAIDFTATGVDKKQYMDLELNLASANFPANGAVYVWLLALTDGTNYEDGAAGTPGTTPARAPDVIFPLRTVNGVQRVFQRLALTTPDKGELLLQNNSGVTFAASGNTLKYYTYGDEIVTV